MLWRVILHTYTIVSTLSFNSTLMRDSLNTSLISNNNTTNFRNIVIKVMLKRKQKGGNNQNGDERKTACLLVRVRNISLAPIAMRIGPILKRTDV